MVAVELKLFELKAYLVLAGRLATRFQNSQRILALELAAEFAPVLLVNTSVVALRAASEMVWNLYVVPLSTTSTQLPAGTARARDAQVAPVVVTLLRVAAKVYAL